MQTKGKYLHFGIRFILTGQFWTLKKLSPYGVNRSSLSFCPPHTALRNSHHITILPHIWLSYCPLCPLLNQSQQAGENWGLWQNRSQTDTVVLLHILGSSIQIDYLATQTPTSALTPTVTQDCALDRDPNLYEDMHTWQTMHLKSNFEVQFLSFSDVFVRIHFDPHLHGSVVQLFHQQPDHIQALYCGGSTGRVCHLS